MKKLKPTLNFKPTRFKLIIAGLMLVMLAVVARMVYLTLFERPFLVQQADVRMLRTIKLPAYRGMILSSDKVPLAISIPVDDVWVNPQDFPKTYENVQRVSHLLGLSFNFTLSENSNV